MLAAPRVIAALTGLRFCAAMMVFLSHYPPPEVSGRLLRITQSGYAGVTFFFVLSGFVLALNYTQRFTTAPRAVLWPFLLARFCRIYPLYLVCTLYAFMALDRPAHLWLYLLALQTWSPDLKIAFGLDGPGWSVGVEMFLYAAFPPLLIALGRFGVLRTQKRIVLAGLGVIAAMLLLALAFSYFGGSKWDVAAAHSAHRWLYRTPATRLLDFLLGMLAAGFVRLRGTPDDARFGWRVLGYAAIVCTLTLMASADHFYSAFSWDVSYALPSVALIVSLTLGRSGVLARLLGHKVLVSLGEASFALYLVQALAHPMIGAQTGSETLSMLQYALFCAATLGIAYAAHFGIERPAQSGLRRLFGLQRNIAES